MIPTSEQFHIKNPLVIVFQSDEGDVTMHIYPPDGYSHKEYGLLICDLVRHVAGCFRVPEDDVWEWVMKERRSPTTAISRPS